MANYIIKGYVKSQAEIDALGTPSEGWVVIVDNDADSSLGRYPPGTEILYTDHFGWGLNSLTTPLQFRAWVADNFYNKKYIDNHFASKIGEGRVKVDSEDTAIDFLYNKIQAGAGLNKKIITGATELEKILYLYGNSTFKLKALTAHCDLEFNPKTQEYTDFNLNFIKDSGTMAMENGVAKLTQNIHLIFANFGFEFPGYETNFEGLKVTIGARLGGQLTDRFSYVLDSSLSDTTVDYSVGELPEGLGLTNFNLTLTTEPSENFRSLNSVRMHARMYIIGPAE